MCLSPAQREDLVLPGLARDMPSRSHPTTRESTGAYSSHSAGARRSSIFCSSSPSVTPNDSAVLVELTGADR